MKYFTILLTSLLLNINLIAQQKIIIFGQVKDLKSNVLPHADVLITTSDENEHILQFSMTDSKGHFNLEYAPTVGKMLVKVSSMGFKKKVQELVVDPKKQVYEFSFVMDEKMETLKEVEVKAKPKVRINKDTTVFNLQNIVNGSEQVVEDIIKKLPGMIVKGDGKLKFKDKEVSTVLLEDDDLFGGAYTIGTKNIKAEDIKGIEAIENYTKNPLLQGVTISDKVAVRLRFKKGVSLANNMELGYGHKERYYANHTGIVIAKKLKAFNLFNYNNLGKNVGKQHFNPMSHLFMLGAGEETNETKCDPFLESSSISSLFKAQQSNKNNAFFGSLNLVPHITKTLKVRANLNFMSDRSQQDQKFQSIISTNPDNPIVIEQEDKRKYKPRYFNADVYLEKYFGKNSVENTIQFSRLRNTSAQTGITNGENQELNSRSKEFYLYNSTRLSRRINSRNSIQLQADFAFHETPERLYLMPGINFDNNQLEKGIDNFQDINSKKESAKLKAYYNRILGPYSKFNVQLGVNYHNKNLSSTLSQNSTKETYINTVDYKIYMPTIKAAYQFNYNRLNIEPNIETRLYNYEHLQKGSGKLKGEKLLLNTGLNVFYNVSARHDFRASLFRKQSQPEEKNLFTDFVMISNRSLQNNQLSFDAITSRGVYLSYAYRNMIKDFEMGIRFSYNDKDKAMQSALNISQDVTYTTYFLSNKGSNSYNYSAHFRSFINFLNSNLKLRSNYDKNQYYNSVNGSELRKNQSKSWSYNYGLETNFIGHFIFGNSLAYNKSIYSSAGRESIKNESLKAGTMMIYKPGESFIARADYSYNIPSLRKKDNYVQNFDATIQFFNKSKNMSFKIEGRNLLNQKNMDFISNTDYARTISNKTLQERYFLFSVGFRF
jgi:hypothetical protein